MFSSLDRVDIVLQAGPDGRQQFVQTDHRTAEEIEQYLELSTVFALVRILNARRLAKADEPKPMVIYSAMERPPEVLCRAIHAAGGRLAIGDSMAPEAEEEQPLPLDDVVQRAFQALATAVAVEHDVALTQDGLMSLEESLTESELDPKEGEFAYWSAVVKLGVFGGEVIRRTHGGRWLLADSGTLCFLLATRFRGSEAMVNPLGKAIKRFANGEADSLAALVHMICGKP